MERERKKRNVWCYVMIRWNYFITKNSRNSHRHLWKLEVLIWLKIECQMLSWIFTWHFWWGDVLKCKKIGKRMQNFSIKWRKLSASNDAIFQHQMTQTFSIKWCKKSSCKQFTPLIQSINNKHLQTQSTTQLRCECIHQIAHSSKLLFILYAKLEPGTSTYKTSHSHLLFLLLELLIWLNKLCLYSK